MNGTEMRLNFTSGVVFLLLPLFDLLLHIYFFNSNIRDCHYYFRIAIYHIHNQSVFILYIL